MVQMLFYVRFRGQLRRTKPELISTLEDAVAEAAAAAGGDVQNGRKVLSASFDDERLSFWLDIVIFLEKANGILQKVSSALYGYALVLGRNIPESSAQLLCRSLIRECDSSSTGIWCSIDVRDALDIYMVFGRSAGTAVDDVRDEYREFRDFRSFDGNGLPPRREYPYREKIVRTLAHGNRKNTLLIGPEFMGKRDAIYFYSAGLLGDVPPLVIRFGAGGFGPVFFADAFTPVIRAFIASTTTEKKMKELDTAHGQLFRERIREEWSFHLLELSSRFFNSLLDAYINAAGVLSINGLLILENLSLADSLALKIIKDIGGKILILASDSSSEENLKIWNTVFPRMMLFTPEEIFTEDRNPAGRDLGKIVSQDLWEASYNILLLRRYFPAYLFPQLFEEEGLNRDVFFRAVQMLSAYGVIVQNDIRPKVPDFYLCADKIPVDRKGKICSAVRSRILAWALSGRLRSCFNLLKILSDLGENPGNVLVLRSLRADVLNGTCSAIDRALSERSFAKLVGKENAPVLAYAYKTLKILVWGMKDEIQRAFRDPAPPMALADGKPCYGGCQSQVQVNLTSFFLGCRNIDAASEAIRKAMLLNKELGKDSVPAYRLFALVNFFRQRIDDALEYISFALEDAERTEQNEELVLACYFGSSINFIYGNLSKAERLAKKAEEIASELGQTRWVMRSKFQRGRLCFEIGRYSDALEIFESLEAEAASGGEDSPAAMVQTIRAWIFRTRNFLGRFFPPENYGDLSGLDAEIFRIEAAYLTGDYERASSLAISFLSSGNDVIEIDSWRGVHTPSLQGGVVDYLFTEQPDWRSGFSQCESMFQSGKNQAARLAWVYRAMAQCALHPSPEKKGEILGSMQRFMRDEFLPDTDSNDSFFFYAWYSMLRDSQNPGESGLAQVDINTVVSMAYKRLQRRAGRIDDTAVKQAFLNMSRWNGTICLAAREYKLI